LILKAYGFAPASLIAPLGTVALISNAIVAPLLLKEKFRRQDALGILLSILGAAVVVMSSKGEEPAVSFLSLFVIFALMASSLRMKLS
jgi:drug/metabolite transporter (DMT)-like permease